MILAIDTDADRAEALAVALTNPVAALTSFRLLAADAKERKRHEAQLGSI